MTDIGGRSKPNKKRRVGTSTGRETPRGKKSTPAVSTSGRKAPAKGDNKLRIGSGIAASFGARPQAAPTPLQAISRSREGAGAGYTSTDRAQAQARDMRQSRLEREQMMGEEEPSGFDFLDSLMNAMNMFGGGGGGDVGGGGVDFGALKDAARRNAGEADSKIGAMYRQLQDSYRGDAAGIQGAYDQAQRGVADVTAQTLQQTNAGYDRAQEDQSNVLGALGISSAQASLGGAADRDQAIAASNLQQNSQATQNQLATNAASAQQFNTGITGAAGLAGNEQRAAIQRALQNKLAELEAGESESRAQAQAAQASAQGDALSQALRFASEQGDNFYREREFQSEQSQQEFQNQLALKRFIAQQQQETAQSVDPTEVLRSAQRYAEKAGIEQSPALLNAFRELLSR